MFFFLISLSPRGNTGQRPWISTSLSSGRCPSPPPVGLCSSLFPSAVRIVVQGSPCYVTWIFPKCMAKPSPLSGFGFVVDLILFHQYPQVYIAYLVGPPDSQYVSEAVINKHMQFTDNCFGGFPGLTAIERNRFYVCIEDSDFGVSGDLGREPCQAECSKSLSCLADEQRHILVRSSLCADVASQVHKLLPGFAPQL